MAPAPQEIRRGPVERVLARLVLGPPGLIYSVGADLSAYAAGRLRERARGRLAAARERLGRPPR